jgi:general secretion pathway protein B
MSYILDALKKLEQEKTRKSRTAGKINISGELFAHERTRPAEGRRLKSVVLVSVAVVATFLVTWFALKGSAKRKQVPVVATAVRPNPAAIIPIPVPAPPLTTPPQAQIPAAIPSKAGSIPAAPVVAHATAPKSSPPADEEEEERRSRRRASRKPAPPAQASSVAALKPVPVPAPADIKVSGIAWQDERSARRAVVNGFLMREGTLVSGAKISEILQDRVKFTLGGNVFEVSLISPGSTAVGK